jgi:PAS domain S-box-containing protein
VKEDAEIVKELRAAEKLGKLRSKSRNVYEEVLPPSETSPEETFEGTLDVPEIKKGETIQVNIGHQRRLLEAEEKYEKIFRLSPEAIIVLDPHGTVIDVNERVFDWLGYKPEEIIGNAIVDLPFLRAEEQEKAAQNFMMRIKGNKLPPYELRFVAKNGDQRIGRVHAALLKDERGNITSDLVMVSDITQQKHAEDTLHRTLGHLKELEFIVNHSKTVIFLWRAEKGWPVEFVSENITQFGYTKEDFLSGLIPYAKIVHEEDIERVSNEVTSYSRGGATEFIQEYRIRTKSGDIRWVEDRTWVRRDASGTITHYQGIILDITERKNAEEQYRDFFENATDLIQSVDREWHLLYVNRAWRETLGYSEEDIKTLTLLQVIHPDCLERCMEIFKRILSGEEVRGIEAAFRTKDGRKILVEGNASCRFVDGKPVNTRAIFHDVTERKKIEDMLKQKIEELERYKTGVGGWNRRRSNGKGLFSKRAKKGE